MHGGIGLILKNGDKSACVNWSFGFLVHMIFLATYLVSEVMLFTEAKGL